MNTQIKIPTLLGMIFLLLSACGRVETNTVEEVPDATTPTVENPVVTPSAVSVVGTAVEKPDRYIGLNYPPMPDGLIEVFAMLIQDSEDHSFLLVTEGGNEMLWLSEFTHRDSSGNAFWGVKDILDLSDQESGVSLLPDGCSLNGEPDSEILVLGRDGVVLQAWRADTTLDVFEVIPVDGIECQSDKAWSFP